jgi:Arc/MetJ-type ribon-helix-helix transcriptional regulator
VKVFSCHLSREFDAILSDLVKLGHFHTKSDAARCLITIGLVEYLKQYYALKAEPDGAAS